MLLNPFAPLAFIKITSLKATTTILLILLIKSNLLKLKGGLIGGLFALILISGILASTSIAVGSLIYAYRVKKNSGEEKNTVHNSPLLCNASWQIPTSPMPCTPV